MTELSARAAALRAHLQGRGRTRTLSQIETAFDRADPGNRGRSRARWDLADCLDELQTAGVLEQAKSLDRSRRPPLPVRVRWLDEAVPAPTPGTSTRPWHPMLGSADTVVLTARQRELLRAVSDWLFGGGASSDNPVVTLTERSLEVTGDEKAFIRNGELLKNFGLDPETLRCERVTPPLYSVQVGTGSVALVVENMDTFDSLRHALTADPGGVGLLCWGAGAAFETSVLELAKAERPVEQVRYFGDLDVAGLRIPASAAQNARFAELPPVRPWFGLYQALYERGRESEGPQRCTLDQATELAGWLPEPMRERAVTLLCEQKRLAQEAVHRDFLLSNSEWRTEDPGG